MAERWKDGDAVDGDVGMDIDRDGDVYRDVCRDGFGDAAIDVDAERLACSQGSETLERFDAFYEFAFPRVYRYAQRRMQNDAQAEVLCRLVLIRAISTLGGLETVEHRVAYDRNAFAFWLFCLARRAADELNARRAEHPDLVDGSDLADELEDQTLEILRSTGAKWPAV